MKDAKFQNPVLKPFFHFKPIGGSFDQSLDQADKNGLKIKQISIVWGSFIKVNTLTWLFPNWETFLTWHMAELKYLKVILCLEWLGWKIIRFHRRIYPSVAKEYHKFSLSWIPISSNSLWAFFQCHPILPATMLKNFNRLMFFYRIRII